MSAADNGADGLVGRGLVVVFGRGSSSFRAVDRVDIRIERGEVVGLVGESGSGKTTVGKVLAALHRPSAGEVRYDGQTLAASGRSLPREVRARIQMIFQDPYSSLNPRQRAVQAVAEVFRVWHSHSRQEARSAALAMLAEVGISPEQSRLRPHSLSGGQRQRVSVARALAVEPHILVADEPTSSIDQSAQAQMLTLLARIRQERQLGILFITHDLRLVRDFADRMYVMRSGEVVETGSTRQVFHNPSHRYTKDLIDAIPGRADTIRPGVESSTL